MAKRKKYKKRNNNFTEEKQKIKLKDDTRNTIYGILFFVLALFLFMSAFEMAGVAGDFFYKIFYYLFGIGYSLLPVLFLLLGASFVKSKTPNIGTKNFISSILFLISGLGIINIVATNTMTETTNAGGLLGKIFSYPFVKLFDIYAAILMLSAVFIISLLMMFDTKPNIKLFFTKIWNFIMRKKTTDENYYNEEEEYEEDGEEEEEEEEAKSAKGRSSKEEAKSAFGGSPDASVEASREEEMPIKKTKIRSNSNYVPPPLSLLEEDKGKPNTGDLKANANIIKRTLANFGIEVEMDEITIGPTVTRYALKPAEGVKLSRIVALQNDLALALAVHPIRIEAPIPGKSLVGIEIPNKSKSIVGLATLLKDQKFQNSTKALTIALGRSIAGKAMFGDLSKMPHCLVAGTTGSGKSVTIHSMITSLIYKNGPEDLKFIMVDPKRVELTLYKNIPHLLTPVITDAKKTILSLKWAAKEMDRRYDILEEKSVKDISSYHANIYPKELKEKGEENTDRMPYIVIVIDELADIMTTYPRELEASIVRLAQMSRAVGIHLILSTQRPEVSVITGLIKANIPSRIALRVSSQIDSRTIIDAGGAEKLLGAGDMLYSSGETQLERLQSAFISENEVKSVVNYLSEAYKDEINDEITLTNSVINREKGIFESTIDNGEDDDELYEEAKAVLIEAGKASTSFLQRKLKLGYARAARIMDLLEERGVIGPQDGAKPREVIIGRAKSIEDGSPEES